MKKHVLFFLNLLIINLLAAQNATISGLVADAKTGEPLIGASIKSGQIGTVTDLDGRYNLSLAAGEARIEYSFTGFDSKTEKITLSPGENRVLNLTLGEAENILQTATVTAGKYDKPLSEVTVSLEVVKPKLIESVNATAVDQVLDKVPGVSMIDGQANIRGGSGYSYGAGSRVLLLVDDLPALQADAGLANWGDVAVENIGQVEVLKGAASALYGSSAMNGIINIRTAYAKSKPETNASVFYQYFDDPKDKSTIWWGKDDSYSHTDKDSFLVNRPFTTGVSFAHRQKFGKLDLAFGSYGLFANSYNRDTYRRYGRVTPNFRYRVSDRLVIGLNSNFNFGKSGSFFLWNGNKGTAIYEAGLNSANNSAGRLRYTIDPSIHYTDKFNNRHKLLVRYYNIKNKNAQNRANRSSTNYGEYQFQRNIDRAGLVVTAGAVAYVSKIRAELYGDTAYTSTNYATYLQLDQKIGQRLNISAGVRYEKFILTSPEYFTTVILSGGDTCILRPDTVPNGRIAESKPVFRLGLNYRIAEATYLRASWGQGYRFPTVAEKFITTDFGAAQVLPNSKLTPETGWSAEVGVKQGFKISDWRGYMDLTGFISEYTDMMEFTFEILPCDPQFGFGLVPAFSSKNIGNTRITGQEISIAGQGKLFGKTTSLLAGYTRIDPRFRNWTPDDTLSSSVNYNVLKYRFRHTVKVDAETELNKFTIGASYNYNSKMEAIDRVFEFFIPGLGDWRRENNHGYGVLGMRIGYQMTKNFKISGIMGNLLNEAYSERPGSLEAPRNFTIRLDGKF